MKSENNLGYAIHHLGSAMDRQTDILLQDKFQIGFSQFKILMVLAQQNALQQQQIAKALGQTEASVSRQIKILISQGLISSTKNPENRRESITSLTAKGSHTVAQALAALEAYYYPMFSHLSPAQLEAFSHILDSIHARLCSTGKPGTCDV